MVNVIPLFKRQTIKNLVIDDNLNMGEYSVIAEKIISEQINSVDGSFSGDVTINGQTINEGNLDVNGDFSVAQDSSFQNDVVVNGDLTVNGTITNTAIKNSYIMTPVSISDYFSIGVAMGSYIENNGYSGVQLLTLPPNITISGTIICRSDDSSTVNISFYDVKHKLLMNQSVPTTDTTITIPTGTNLICIGNLSKTYRKTFICKCWDIV